VLWLVVIAAFGVGGWFDSGAGRAVDSLQAEEEKAQGRLQVEAAAGDQS
jgi:hypothetical protein